MLIRLICHSVLFLGLLLCVTLTACSQDAVESPSVSTPTRAPDSARAVAAPTPGDVPATHTTTVAANSPTPVPTPMRTTIPARAAIMPTHGDVIATRTATAAANSSTVVPMPAPVSVPAPSPVPPSATAVGKDRSMPRGALNLVSRQVVEHEDVHKDVSEALAAWGPGIAYSRLLRFRSGEDIVLPSLSVECEICESWTMVDGTTFEFILRDDVRWQDLHPVDGRKLTAQDIVYSYQRQRSEGAPNAALLHIVDSMEAPSEDVLRLSLHAPDADILVALADGHSKVVSQEAVELNGDLRRGPTVGSGPWILDESQSAATYTFSINEYYFEADSPRLSRLVIHKIPDGRTSYAAFRVNNLDVHRLLPQEWKEFSRQKPDASMLAFKEVGRGLEVAFNVTAMPFEDARVRQAAMLAMRPSGAIEEIWQGAAYLTQGVPLAGADWRLSQEELESYFDDHRRATALLAESVGSLPVSVEIEVGDFNDEYIAQAERIAVEMNSVGFDAGLNVVDRRRFGEQVWFGGEFQMFVGPTAPVSSPNAYMLAVLSGEGAWNTTGHRDESLDALILAQAGEYDPAERQKLVVEAQRRVMDQAYRFMPAAAVSLWAWWPNVQGLEPNFSGSEYSHWSRVWLTE